MPTLIPKVIHQTWKTADVPDRFHAFVASWKTHHPDWEYRLWTDDDLHAFIKAHYPEFLAIFEGYRQPIKRVDAARYLILRTLGGLYADLDFECFKSIEPLLDGATAAIGLEPHVHVTYPMSRKRGVRHILCPSLLASVPNHPYWDVVYENLRYYHEVTEILDATGPFLLTRSLDEMERATPGTVRLLPAHEVYPVGYVALQQGEFFDFRRWDDATRGATAMHHWDHSWTWQQQWFGPGPAPVVPPWFREQTVVRPELRDAEGSTEPSPRVTALMVTGDRPALAALAIDSFHRQTYPNKELVIVDDGSDEALARAIAGASGDYVILWDDDVLSHPLRIEVQLHHLRAERAQASVLARPIVWWPAARRFALGEQGRWDRSMMCRTDRLREVDRCSVHIDLPRLCVQVVHGANEPLWERAERRYEGTDADRVYRHLATDFPLDAVRSACSP